MSRWSASWDGQDLLRWVQGDLTRIEVLRAMGAIDERWATFGQNQSKTNQTLLMMAVQTHVAIFGNASRERLIQRLLESGANPNVEHDDGETILHTAVSIGDVNIAKVLIEHGADVHRFNHRGDTPLLALWGHPSSTEPDWMWGSGNWPTLQALLDTLIQHGAGPNATHVNRSHRTALHDLVKITAEGWPSMFLISSRERNFIQENVVSMTSRSIDRLLEWGANPNQQGGEPLRSPWEKWVEAWLNPRTILEDGLPSSTSFVRHGTRRPDEQASHEAKSRPIFNEVERVLLKESTDRHRAADPAWTASLPSSRPRL